MDDVKRKFRNFRKILFTPSRRHGKRIAMNYKISAMLRPDQLAWIKRVKSETGATITHIVRQAIDALMHKRKGK